MRARAEVTLVAYARLRPQEARALQWGDVGERTLRVERAAAGCSIKRTKTEELRTVRLLPPLGADLRNLRDDVDAAEDEMLIFPTARGSLMCDEDWRN